MTKENVDSLLNRIWVTRTARINAEKRLIGKEEFCQFLNVYYSLITIFLSVVAFIKKNDTLSLLTIFMTITLLVAILYLNSQQHLKHARDYRKNYTALQQLEFRLKHISCTDDAEIRLLEDEYCHLLDSSCNHCTFDYYCALHDSRGLYKDQCWTGWIEAKYWWGIIWRIVLKAVLVVLPVFLYFQYGVI